MPFVVRLLIFIVGAGGYAAFCFGLWRLSPVAAYIVGGALAMWYSWYVSAGFQLRLAAAASKQGSR